MNHGFEFGVCYYPEQWHPSRWSEDAASMAALGIGLVRIGEFAWSRLEPRPGAYDWEWLDDAIETLAAAGLRVMLSTPTACPPKWLVDAHPDILAVGADGRARGFGSRRHYCFSSATYRRESRRIVSAMAERYGRNPAVVAWQTDNEYGCHDTVLSYSGAALQGFRIWLRGRYADVAAVNAAWGNVFWSQEYGSFDEVGLPAGTVTEANPAHRLDFWRYSSEQVVEFNREQVEILRRLAPGRTLLHNFMGFSTDFDHYPVAADLDVAGWDSYPLGFLEWLDIPDVDKVRYARQGHPDVAAFHHDLYRGVGRGRFWVVEQQPGPVNWAPYNPAPLAGMVRAWTLEAYAHGAEVVSYFRWRQAPFAQEQMHSGLNLPDGREDDASDEVRSVVGDLRRLPPSTRRRAQVALIFDYQAEWVLRIQPQGADFRYMPLVLEFYSALRRLGLDVDVLPVGACLDGYSLVVVPSLPIVDAGLVTEVERTSATVLVGPRTGSKTKEYGIPAELPPGPLKRILPITVRRVESLRPGLTEIVRLEGARVECGHWLEHVEAPLGPELSSENGVGVWYRHGRINYLACWPPARLLEHALRSLCAEAGVAVIRLPDGLRITRRGDLAFAFNYDRVAVEVPAPGDAEFLLGTRTLPPAGVAAWRSPPAR
jgi:beta-galactosidase